MRSFLLPLVGLALVGITPAFAQPTEPTDGLSDLTVPLDKPSTFLESSRKTLDALLAGVHPGPKIGRPQSEIAKTGQYILWGDLFQTGDCFALMELTPQSDDSDNYGVAFAEWEDGAWKLRQVWKVPTTWRPVGWKRTEENYLSETPETQPFELRNLGGGSTPELIIAGEVDKYFQDHYLFRFLRAEKTLALVASDMAIWASDEYVVLYSKSPRRAIWEEWQYLKWKGDELVPVASWHDEVGYNDQDPTFSEGEKDDARGKSEVIRILYGDGTDPEEDVYELTRNGKPFGRMRVNWREGAQSNLDADTIEKAWLFEKVTGLSRQLYPDREGTEPIPKLENFAKVSIEGCAEAARLFEMGR